MIISAHQPAYLPWLGLVHKLVCSDIFVIMDDVQFEKNSFTNRNRVLQGDREVMLTIPLAMKGHTKKSIRDMKATDLSWQKKHLKTICQSYSRSPYFDAFQPFFEELYALQTDSLVAYCDKCLETIVAYLGINTRIIHASGLGIQSRKEAYIIELTQKLNGDIFIFGNQGKTYADEKNFKASGIRPYFQSYHHPVYHQGAEEFHPFMTVFDLFFNVPRSQAMDIIMQGNPGKTDIRNNAT